MLHSSRIYDTHTKTGEHIKHISKKIASNIWLLSKMKVYLSHEHRIQFYKSNIQPHIDFCNIIWGNTSESNKQKILRMEKRAVRVILDYNVENSHEAMKSLNIQSIYDRLFLRKAKFIVREPVIGLIKWLRLKGLKVFSYVEKCAEFKNQTLKKIG